MNTGTCASMAPGPSPAEGISRAQAARTKVHSPALRYTGLYSSSSALAACDADGPPASSTAPLPTAAFSMKRRLGRLSGGVNSCHVVGGCRSSLIALSLAWRKFRPAHAITRPAGLQDVVLSNEV
ncbi:hypothetical protein ACFSTJ_09280 [Ottowia pentelensis]|uniref:hypothetical protein n=1 Tax=Ottowia pentelensis TaxID=511108 RepID=UPI00363AD564